MFLEHRIVTIRCPLENFTNKLTVNLGRIKILKGFISIFFFRHICNQLFLPDAVQVKLHQKYTKQDDGEMSAFQDTSTLMVFINRFKYSCIYYEK